MKGHFGTGRELLTLEQMAAVRRAWFDANRRERVAEAARRGMRSATALAGLGPRSCAACLATDEQTYLLREIVHASLLPHAECTCDTHDKVRGVCACLFIFDDREDPTVAEEPASDAGLRTMLAEALEGETTEAEAADFASHAQTLDAVWPRENRPAELVEFIRRFWPVAAPARPRSARQSIGPDSLRSTER